MVVAGHQVQCFASTASPFHDMALRPQQRHQPVAMVALHFDHTLLHCSARATGGLELLAQRKQRWNIQHQATHQRHGFAAAALGFA